MFSKKQILFGFFAVLLSINTFARQNAINNASNVYFVLKGLKFHGGEILEQSEKIKPFKKYIGKKISVKKLNELVANLNKTYKSKGYFISYAYIPPQKSKNGIITINLVEGYIKDVIYSGKISKTNINIAKALLAPAIKENPLKTATIENAVMTLGSMPGLEVKSKIKINKNNNVAANLILNFNEKNKVFLLKADNYLNKLDGVIRLGFVNEHYNIFPGSKVGMQVSKTINPNRSHSLIAYAQYGIGNFGDNIRFSYLHAKTRPNYTALGFTENINDLGHSKIWNIKIHHPIIKTDKFSQSINFVIDRNSNNLERDNVLQFNDIISSMRLSTDFKFRSSKNKSNQLMISWSHGLGSAFGAQAVLPSRETGSLKYNKFNLEFSSIRRLNSVINLTMHAYAQAGYNPLLAAEEFSVGGKNCGRGYDAGELMGDSGYCIQSQVNFVLPKPEKFGLKNWYGFGFYDRGYVKNQPDIVQTIEDKAASFGLGLAAKINAGASAEIIYALPINHIVNLENNQKGRLFFSVQYLS